MTDQRLNFSAGDLFAGRYELVRELGEGGMGKVFLVKDQMLDGEELALKILLPDLGEDDKYTKRFLREVQLTRKVTHQNVVRTFDVGQTGELFYFTLEYVDGKPLTDFIEDDTLGAYETALIMLQVCQGLAAIHEQGIIHRDLKPANILLTRSGVVKIADFGIARPHISELTSHEEVVGSAPYMAPEIWRGTDIGPAADIYALGAMTYELLTGAWPFDGETAAQVMCKHLEEIPVGVHVMRKDIPDWLGRLVSQMMAKSVEDRPRNVAEIITELTKRISSLKDGEPSESHDEEERPDSSAFFIHSMVTEAERYQWEAAPIEEYDAHPTLPQFAKAPQALTHSEGLIPTIETGVQSSAVQPVILNAIVSMVQFCILGVVATLIAWFVTGPVTQFIAPIIETVGKNSNPIRSVFALIFPFFIAASLAALPFLTLVNRRNDMLINLQTYVRVSWGIFLIAGFIFLSTLAVQIAGWDAIGPKSGINFSRPAEQGFLDAFRIATLSPTVLIGKSGLPSQSTTELVIFFFFAMMYFINLITVIRRDILLIKPLTKGREIALSSFAMLVYASEYFFIMSLGPSAPYDVFRIYNFRFVIHDYSLICLCVNWTMLLGGIYLTLFALNRRKTDVHTGSLLLPPRNQKAFTGIKSD